MPVSSAFAHSSTSKAGATSSAPSAASRARVRTARDERETSGAMQSMTTLASSTGIELQLVGPRATIGEDEIGGRSGFGSGFQSRALQRLEPFRQRQALPRGARLEETLEIRTIDQELVSALVRPQAARPYPAAHRLRRPTSDRCSCEYVNLVRDLLRHEKTRYYNMSGQCCRSSPNATRGYRANDRVRIRWRHVPP